MKKIFITGSSASGKSTLAQELSSRGYNTLDIDKVMGSCNWYNKTNGEIADYHPELGKKWLEDHEWICDFSQIESKIKDFNKQDIVFVAGITSNQFDFLNKFDEIFLLQIKGEDMLYRLKNRDTNSFGKDDSEQEYLLEINEDFEKRMIDIGAIGLDATEPVTVLADKIIEQVL